MIEVSNIPALVDELTELQTQIAVLTARADQIKADLIDIGPGEYCGSVTRVVVSTIAESKTTDWKALAQSFEPTDAQLRQYVVTKKAYSKAVTYGYNARKAA